MDCRKNFPNVLDALLRLSSALNTRLSLRIRDLITFFVEEDISTEKISTCKGLLQRAGDRLVLAWLATEMSFIGVALFH